MVKYLCKVSFIIVNFNGSSFIESCLDSIIMQQHSDFEVIVVDNGSMDDSVKLIQRKYPSIRLVTLDQNMGFTGGNNIGFSVAKGEYIALINNDVVLDRTWLPHMIRGIETSPNIGLCSSKIIISGTNRIDSIGDKFTTAFTGTKTGEYEDEAFFNRPMIMHGACAASALYKRSMIDHIGFFNDMFFLNHEDTDLNMRAWLAGYRCLYVPSAIAHHDVNRTIGKLSDTSVYYFSRNNIWVWFINVPTFFMIRNCFQRIIYEICAVLYFCVLHKKLKPYIKGKVDAFLSLKEILKKRRQVQALIGTSKHKITYDMIPITEYLTKKSKR